MTRFFEILWDVKYCIIVGVCSVLYYYYIHRYDANKAFFQSHDRPCVVKLYSGGELVNTWTSTGRVLPTRIGFYFRDKDTMGLVEVSGDVVLTPIME